MSDTSKHTPSKHKWVRNIELFIFSSRYVLIPFYIVLFLSLVIYMLVDIREFIHYSQHFNHLSTDLATLSFIEMIDLAMIAFLGKMIITGGYNSFVSKDHGYKNENIGSGLLKVKIATSLVGVTAIALLKKSVVADEINWDILFKVGYIHILFLIGAMVLSYVDTNHQYTEVAEKEVDLKRRELQYKETQLRVEQAKIDLELEKLKSKISE